MEARRFSTAAVAPVEAHGVDPEPGEETAPGGCRFAV